MLGLGEENEYEIFESWIHVVEEFEEHLISRETADEGVSLSTARETLQELACVVLALIPKEALLSK